MDIRTNESVERLGHEAQTALKALLHDNRDQQILLLCSGGSCFELLSEILKDTIGSHITLGALDERYSAEETINNFAQLQKLEFYTTAIDAGVRTIDTRPKDKETIEHLAQRFERVLRLWRTNNPGGVVIATMGIGLDGHTAGIMPFPEDTARFHELFENPDVWVCGYDAGEKNQYPLRVTTTLTFLKEIDYSIVYCVGESKRDALMRVLADGGTYAETPARVIRDIKNVALFTDITPV